MRAKSALISGAGIAGPATAYWLSAAGWETTIVEQQPRLRMGGYVIDFWGLGYELAERMGLASQIEEVGYHVGEMRVVGERGQRLAGFGAGVLNDLTGEKYITLARSDLSRLLLSAATRTQVIFGDEIAALENEDLGVAVQFESGSERRFDLVIGADGLHSRVRELAFGPEKQFEKRLGYAVAAFEVDGYEPRDPDMYLMHSEPGRMLGRFTLRGGRSLFLFVFTFDGPAPKSLDDQKALLRSRYGRDGWETPAILRALDEVTDLYLDGVSQIIAPAWSTGRVALVGDAAFCVSLLAGQGSALAIVAAYVLAGELAEAGDNVDQALKRYEARLRDYIEMKQSGAQRFARAFAPQTRFGLWFRNLVIRSFAVPGVAKSMFAGEITDQLDLPDYPFPDGGSGGFAAMRR